VDAIPTEAHTHSDIRIACSTVVKPTIAQNIAPYSLSPKEKWTKNPTSHCSKWHPEKSTTLCNGPPTTNNILHLTLLFSHHKPTKTGQAQALTYYQSYQYATTNQSQPSPTSQITYPMAVPQITCPMPNNTNPQVKTEAKPPPPPPP
jgi:hypothetical protein